MAECEMHYVRYRRTGSYELLPRRPRPIVLCAVDGCVTPARSRVNTLRVCKLHWKRWRRNGHWEQVRKVAPPRRERGICIMEGCGKTDTGAHGYCKMHKTRIERHGDPSISIPPSERKNRALEEHPAWTGDDVTYRGVHQRVRAIHGSASKHSCVDCGGQAKQWSYDHKDPDERLTGPAPHSIHIEHYEPRCISCHKKFDLAYLRSIA